MGGWESKFWTLISANFSDFCFFSRRLGHPSVIVGNQNDSATRTKIPLCSR